MHAMGVRSQCMAPHPFEGKGQPGGSGMLWPCLPRVLKALGELDVVLFVRLCSVVNEVKWHSLVPVAAHNAKATQ